MRLARPFYRLPVRFDVTRLQQEIAALPTGAWVSHPNGLAGNSALRLISVDGGDNDDVNGVMQPTAHLRNSAYLRQVLASFGVVWSRSRLMKLAPHAQVPEHADINYHWYFRVRVHIPVATGPAVQFRCGDEALHMAAGEAWIFDNWRRHSVVNAADVERIHLVADTTGSAAFWQLVSQGTSGMPPYEHHYDPAHDDASPLMERTALAPVMNPAEVELLVLDLRAELQGATAGADTALSAPYHAMLDAFCRDWRQLYALYGEGKDGWALYAAQRDRLRSASKALGDGIVMRTNRIGAHQVLEGRLLRAILPAVPTTQASITMPQPAATLQRVARPRQPVFIIAAPRSGSTLLFETLSTTGDLCTLGGEAHWLIEDIEELRPGAAGVDSNRLTAEHATAERALRIIDTIANRLRDADDAPISYGPELRLLEKTPKNALRVPFLNRIFPDALFIFLWRDPRENLSSIIEAWRSGRWKTYNGLDGFDGPWSLLLPPGWRAMNGRPLQDIAAFQWDSANRIALDDLAALPADRWLPVRYAQLVADPKAAISRLCGFAGVRIDDRLARRLGAPLPLSRFTQTPPDSNKWRGNAHLIEAVLPALESTWHRLEALDVDPPDRRGAQSPK